MGRLNRDQNPSTCLYRKACPGTADANLRHYNIYVYTNTLAVAQCVTVRVSEACGDNHLLSAAYLWALKSGSG